MQSFTNEICAIIVKQKNMEKQPNDDELDLEVDATLELPLALQVPISVMTSKLLNHLSVNSSLIP